MMNFKQTWRPVNKVYQGKDIDGIHRFGVRSSLKSPLRTSFLSGYAEYRGMRLSLCFIHIDRGGGFSLSPSLPSTQGEVE